MKLPFIPLLYMPKKFWTYTGIAIFGLFVCFVQMFLYGLYLDRVQTYLSVVVENENRFIDQVYEYNEANNENIESLDNSIGELQKEIMAIKKQYGNSKK